MATSDRSPDTRRSHVRQQEVIAAISQRGLDCDDIDTLLADATAAVRSAIDGDYCGVFELCADGSTARLRDGAGWPDNAIGSRVPVTETSGIGYSRASGEPVINGEVCVSRPALTGGITGSITSTIGSGDEPWGVLGVYTRDNREFSSQEATFVDRVADILGSSIENVQTKRELRAEKTLKDRIVETSPVGIIVADIDGTMILANERAEAITGRGREELVEMAHGDPAWDLVDPDGKPLSADRLPFNRVLETGEPIADVTFGIRDPDGQRVWITETAMPVTDGTGDLAAVISEFEDVTDERRYRQQSQQLKSELEATFERITDAFFGLNTEWEFTYLNDRAAALIDPEGTGLVGKNIWDAFPDAVNSTFEREYRRAMDRQEPTSFEAYFEPLDTRFEVHGYPSETGLSVYFRDVTTQTRIKRELRETNNTLNGLYEIIADRDRSFDDKIDSLLELGRDRLGLDVGYLATVDEDDDWFEITHVSDATGQLSPGSAMPLSETYCHWTIQSDDPFGFTSSPADYGIDTAVYETWELDCYLGSCVDIGGERYGTLCFEDASPRSRPFTPAERSFVELTTQWISYELERRQYQHELERYREYTDDVIDAIDDIFYVLDSDGRLLRSNEALRSATGYSAGEVSSMDATDFFSPADRESVTAAVEEAFETGTTRLETQLRTSSGESIPYEFVASALTDPSGKPVLTGIGRDITERKATQCRLEELVADLEASNERLEQFAYAASHDLQEPLRMVSSYLTLIERRYGDELDEDGCEFIEFAVDGADRMQAMIDGLLAYSRVDTQGDPFESVEMAAVVADVLADFELRIEETNATIDVDWEALPCVCGDPSQLRQLIQNLVDNAITYAGSGPPRICISAENDSSTHTISIRDEGIGIDPAKTDEIFRVFNRLHSVEEYAGTGIGLALCRRITERHGGTIDISSEPGVGSTVTVTLPPQETIDTSND